MATPDVVDVLNRIRRRDASRPEAQLQADIYQLLTMGALNLDAEDVARLEVPTRDGARRRLDIQVGQCCIEVKKDLRVGNILTDALEQLAGYVKQQTKKYGVRYVGILTDGTTWHLGRLEANDLVVIAVLDAGTAEPDEILVWLESVLATVADIPPTTETIRDRLGADSPAHQLDHATLLDLYQQGATRPEIRVKRDLWSKLLRTAFGSGFDDNPDLFVDHTLLVLTAEAIAHAVAGFDLVLDGLTAQEITRGTRFHDAQIYGVVEEDFFDWVLEVDGGTTFVTELVRRISRFDWSGPLHHDVLKALYTSIISARVRETLGEYYTPDWLADRMVNDVYTDPLNQRLLEPSCGSGTFLIHAVRTYLDAAEGAGLSVGDAVKSLTSNVIGMDVHPVAVALARVSYLIAIGTDRLKDPTRGPLSVPVYLGDSVQWEQHTDLLAGTNDITISTLGDDLVQGGGALFGDELTFPLSVLDDATSFDRLVAEMADAAVDSGKDTQKPAVVMRPILRRCGVVDDQDQKVLVLTFDTMRRLHRSGRNHIWGYYVRNLIRPLWLTRGANRVDVLVGNPPWLRYNKMTPSMQDRYKGLARQRNLLTGRLGGSGRDLSTLFVARCVELYLRDNGRFAFVMPHGVLSRQPHAGFRTGKWSSKLVSLTVAFEEAWDLDRVTTGFPMTSCVIRGRHSLSGHASTLGSSVITWRGRLRKAGDLPWEVAFRHITIGSGVIADATSPPDDVAAPYRHRFRQGAILVPRYMLFVNEKAGGGPLGAGAGRVMVSSLRSPQEKDPWKSMPTLSGTVEREVIHDVYLGETVVPFRTLAPRHAVLPLLTDRIMTGDDVAAKQGLSKWWDEVERAWEQGRKASETKPLLERFDYQSQLSSQLPTATHRVVYSKSGTTLNAARVEDAGAIIDHKLYWAPVASVAEGRYLVGILNSKVLLERVQPLQAKGLFGPRDFDKYVFFVPFPKFDPKVPEHCAVVELAEKAEAAANSVKLRSSNGTEAIRTAIRALLANSGLNTQLEEAVAKVLPTIAAG